MRGQFYFLLASIFYFAVSAHAAKLKNVEMLDAVQIEGNSLVLNGMGLRKVVRYGIPVDVYIAGLYLEKKDQNSDAIIKSPSVKRLVLHFVRTLERDDLLNAFQTGYKDNCQVECDKVSDQFKPFAAALVSVRDKTRMQFTFYPERVVFEVDRPNKVNKTIEGTAFSKNLLAVFINEAKPPTPELRKGLLGITN